MTTPDTTPTPPSHDAPIGSDNATTDGSNTYKPLQHLIDKAVARLSPMTGGGVDAPEKSAFSAIRLGGVCVLLFFGIFGLWSAFAPLDSAAIATGEVILDSNKKTVQHLEGGIVDEILVREGDRVEKGEALIRLDETTAKARFNLLRKQYYTAQATEARLIAERDRKESIDFPEELLEMQDDKPAVKEAIASQRSIFETRKNNVQGRISILKQKIEQFKEETTGLKSQITSTRRQIGLIRDEVGTVKRLVRSKNAPKSRLLSLQRNKARLEGELGQLKSRIARIEQSIGESQIEIINVKNEFLNKLVEELKETQVTLSDLEERIRSSQDKYRRINILAPISGAVTDLKVHTVGGVIKAGEKIMNIVPSDDHLIVEAKVKPRDIDIVRAGLEASVRLTAYKTRFVPPINGEVVNVSADRFENKKDGTAYYKARVAVDSEELEALEDVTLYPGMPADVLIKTGSRTLLTYLFAPIRDSFSKSFRED